MGNHRITITCIGSTPTIERAANRLMDDLNAAGTSPTGNLEHLTDNTVDSSLPLTTRPSVTIASLLASPSVSPPLKNVLQFFAYDHLPLDKQVISRQFAELAAILVVSIASHPELVVALRKLKESKDAAVCAGFARLYP